MLKRFAIDVTMSLLFGIDTNTIEQAQGEGVILPKRHLVVPAFNRSLFAMLPAWR